MKFVPFWDVAACWDEVSPWLQKALDKQTAYDLPSVLVEIMAARMHLWKTDNAAFVTQIQNFPRERIAVIFLCGGEGLDGWANEANAVFGNYAKAHGCSALCIVGRHGWTKAAPGFVDTDTVFRRKI